MSDVFIYKRTESSTGAYWEKEKYQAEGADPFTYISRISQMAKDIEEDFKKKSEKIKDEIKTSEDRLNKKIDDSKLKIIETLGIFVALFTFVSIDFQVFRAYKNPWSIGGLILILLGSLTMFLILLDYLIINSYANNKIKKKIQSELWLVNIVFLVIGFFLFIISKK